MKTILLRLSVAFFTFALNAEPIHFAVIGDFGVDNRDEDRVAQLVKRNNPEFILTVGDNNYPDGCANTIDKNIGKYYQEYIYKYAGKYGQGSSTQRFFPSLGNHDWNAVEECMPSNKRLPYVTYFSLPGNERYYDFVKGDVHFFALDSDKREPDGNKQGSKQYKWFKNAVTKSKAAFQVAYFHHTPYSSGDHGGTKKMQWDFDKLGVEVVIAGHDHIYERLEKKGVVYIVNGLGGAAAYGQADGISDVDSKTFYNEKHGAVFVDATDRTLQLRFINYDNQVVDDITITKSAEQQTPVDQAPIQQGSCSKAVCAQ